MDFKYPIENEYMKCVLQINGFSGPRPWVQSSRLVGSGEGGEGATVSAVNGYMEKPSKEHWKAVQWIMQYLSGSSNVCLQLGRNKDRVIRYVDLDYAGDLERRYPLQDTCSPLEVVILVGKLLFSQQ